MATILLVAAPPSRRAPTMTEPPTVIIGCAGIAGITFRCRLAGPGQGNRAFRGTRYSPRISFAGQPLRFRRPKPSYNAHHSEAAPMHAQVQ
jgi:hypothetical protein